MTTILDRIVEDKRQWLETQKTATPLATFSADIKISDRDFYAALNQDHTVFILECKKASPSKGLIRKDFNLKTIANAYKNHASVISVLTDEAYFQGHFSYLKVVSAQTTQPILCKDFIVDPYQIHWARYHGAHAVLLMLSVLNDEEYNTLSALAHHYKMGVLTEVSTEEELQRAIDLNAKVVGINNRNLRDLSIDLSRTEAFAPKLPQGVIVISESGIHTHQQVKKLNQYADGFLIGSALMAQDNIEQAVRAVILGENKVCGLTRQEDAEAAYNAGAVYGGLIFVPSSPRYLSIEQAANIKKGNPLKFVGVFQNADIPLIIEHAKILALHAIQLHGNESSEFITQLRQALPENCQIWKAHSINDTAPDLAQWSVDRHLVDSQTQTQQGGTGVPFDWSILAHQDKQNVLLAGGLTVDNLPQALLQGFVGVDLNSGVEQQAGIKDPMKIQHAFNLIRHYGRKTS